MDCVDTSCVINFFLMSEEPLLLIAVYKLDVILNIYEDSYNTDNGTQ